MPTSRHPQKRCPSSPGRARPHPLVAPGAPPRRHTPRPASHPARPHHRLVMLATRPPSRCTTFASEATDATVMLVGTPDGQGKTAAGGLTRPTGDQRGLIPIKDTGESGGPSRAAVSPQASGGAVAGSPALSVQVEQDENRDPIEREGSSGPVPRLLP